MSYLGNNKKEKVTLSSDIDCVCLITFIVFLILKLTGVIDWKWVFVLLPIIIHVGIVILALMVIGIVYLIVAIGERMDEKKVKRNKKE